MKRIGCFITILCLCILQIPLTLVHADQEDMPTITIVQTELPEPVIVYPITKKDDAALNKDEYAFCNALFAASITIPGVSVERYLRKIEESEIPYQSVSTTQDITTIYFSDHYFITLKGDPIYECCFHIVNNDKTLSVPMYLDAGSQEGAYAYITKDHPKKEADVRTISNLLESECFLASDVPQTVSEHIYCTLLETTTTWYGMPYETFLQVKQDCFPYSTIRSNSRDIIWCSHHCFTNNEFSMEYAFYFTDNTLSGVGISFNPPNTFIQLPGATRVIVYVPTFFVDLSKTWINNFIEN